MERTGSFFCGSQWMFFSPNDECSILMAKLGNSRANQPEFMSHRCYSVVTEPCTLFVGVGRVYMEVNLGVVSQAALFFVCF